MGFREDLIKGLGGFTQAQREKAYADGIDDGIEVSEVDVNLNPDDEPALKAGSGLIAHGYRDIASTPRDLSSVSQERAIEEVYRLWQSNPQAKAMTEIIVDYILGPGVLVSAQNDDVQAVIDEFMMDPVNQLDGDGLETIVRELGMFGEQLILTFPQTGQSVGAAVGGLVRLGSVDPSMIFSLITHPENRKDIYAVRLKDEGGKPGPVYKVIRINRSGTFEGKQDLEAWRKMVDEDEGRLVESMEAEELQEAIANRVERKLDVRYAEWVCCEDNNREIQLKEITPEGEDASIDEFAGECFLFQINKLSTGVRGRPDLLPMIDWLNRFDQVFFDGAEHLALLNMIIWHLTIEGGSETADNPQQNLRLQVKKFLRMRANSVYATNEKVTLDAVNPVLRAQELEIIIRQLRVFISGGMRIPEHWLAEGGYTNRATAIEMGQPTYRMLMRKQDMVKVILETLVKYQIDVKVALGLLDGEVIVNDEKGKPTEEKLPARDAFSVRLPDINITDTAVLGSALQSVTQAVVMAKAGNIIPLKTAVELIAAIAALLGVEMNIETIIEEMEAIPDIDVSGMFGDQPADTAPDTTGQSFEPGRDSRT